MIKTIKGDIFKSKCHILVNPCNCIGKFKKGLSLQFSKKFPKAHEQYLNLCANGLITVTYEHQSVLCPDKDKYILHIPTKIIPNDQTQRAWLVYGLTEIRMVLLRNKSLNLAMPYLGCGLGGFDEELFIDLAFDTLYGLDNIIEIIKYE